MYNYKMKAASFNAAFFAFANRYCFYEIQITAAYFALKKHSAIRLLKSTYRRKSVEAAPYFSYNNLIKEVAYAS